MKKDQSKTNLDLNQLKPKQFSDKVIVTNIHKRIGDHKFVDIGINLGYPIVQLYVDDGPSLGDCTILGVIIIGESIKPLFDVIRQIEKEYGKVDVISSSMGDWSYHQWIHRDNKGGFSNKGPKKSDGQRKLKYLQAEYLNNTIK